MKSMVLVFVATATTLAFAQGQPKADEKRQATVQPSAFDVKGQKPKPVLVPAIMKGAQYLYIWDDVDGGNHRDVVTVTGRTSTGDCGQMLYEVRHELYSHWVEAAELRRIRTQ